MIEPGTSTFAEPQFCLLLGFLVAGVNAAPGRMRTFTTWLMPGFEMTGEEFARALAAIGFRMVTELVEAVPDPTDGGRAGLDVQDHLDIDRGPADRQPCPGRRTPAPSTRRQDSAALAGIAAVAVDYADGTILINPAVATPSALERDGRWYPAITFPGLDSPSATIELDRETGHTTADTARALAEAAIDLCRHVPTAPARPHSS